MIRSMVPLIAMAFVASVPALSAEVVPVRHFDSVELRGGGNVSVVPGPVQRITILEGSSEYTHIYVEQRGNLKIDTCNRDCPLQYRLRVEVQSPRVPVLAVTGGGAMNVAGGFRGEHDLTVAVSGGGHIDTRAVNADVVTAAVNGGGEMFVRAASVLTGAVSGGGTIRYWGDPQVTSAIDGGGSIRPGH
ncbi:MAG TPA: DUF2807 domain-containing protein [Sphingomicrobium sp.]